MADCAGECGGSATNYFYYYDEDEDGFLGGTYGNLCSGIAGQASAVNSLSLVPCNDTNTVEECVIDSDIDDDCVCDGDANTVADCYDDCGICNGEGAGGADYNGGIYAADCVGDVAPAVSCTNSGSDLPSAVSMDCAGVCSNNHVGGTLSLIHI